MIASNWEIQSLIRHDLSIVDRYSRIVRACELSEVTNFRLGFVTSLGTTYGPKTTYVDRRIRKHSALFDIYTEKVVIEQDISITEVVLIDDKNYIILGRFESLFLEAGKSYILSSVFQAF